MLGDCVDILEYIENHQRTIRFFKSSGPLEHWITTLAKKAWGVDEGHRNRWRGMRPGDILLFHSISPSSIRSKNHYSGIIGLGVIEELWERDKNERWWYAELKSNKEKDRWPLIIGLSEVYITGALSKIDYTKSITEKNEDEIIDEMDALAENRTKLQVYSDVAWRNFPKMSSVAEIERKGAMALVEDMLPSLQQVP